MTEGEVFFATPPYVYCRVAAIFLHPEQGNQSQCEFPELALSVPEQWEAE